MRSDERVRKLLGGLVGDERLRFLAVGGVNTLLGYVLFAVLQITTGDRIGYLVCLYISYAIGIVIAYSLHRRFTFRVRGNLLMDFVRFVGVNVVALGINTALLPLFVEVIGLSPLAAQAITVVVTTLLSYTGHKLFSFRRPLSPAVPEVETSSRMD